jgi:acetyl-CoA carboxylase carboxyl transferase subunit alpha
MRVTAQDQLGLGVIDRIIPEPLGGAHRDPGVMATALRSAIDEELDALSQVSADTLVNRREERFLKIGRKPLT